MTATAMLELGTAPGQRTSGPPISTAREHAEKKADEVFALVTQNRLFRDGMVPASASWSKALPDEHRSAPRSNTGQSATSLEPLQEWEGYIIALNDDSFTARLCDKTAGADIEEEIADFPREEVREDDQPLLREGAVFRWVIGYQRQAWGTKLRTSQIIFRRMPAWNRAELKRAKIEAAKILSGIVWD
jgi:hypothetical protein